MEHKILRQKKTTGKNRRKLSSGRLTLRPKETTAITGLSVGATYNLLESGAMPSIRVGKKFLIPRAALIEWINSCGKAHVTVGLKEV
jgi:excisionase family DNA binding protein